MTASAKMPVLFIGHGSPMNAIEDNDFSRFLTTLGTRLPRPQAILSISAHWMTEGTWVTQMAKPKTIHDFYGFPKPLFEVSYPAPGSPQIANLITTTLKTVHPDKETWGLDHGTWAILRHIYPKADIPTLQLSLHMEEPASYHYELGEKLRFLREKGVLIVGSGNIVHNLGKINWDENGKPFEWAVQFDEWTKSKISARDMKALTDHYLDAPGGKESVPTPEHYYPLLYTLGASEKTDSLSFEYEGIQNGSISMRALSFGQMK
jgi:4,5-DOPA dioxygenase extradiol